MLQPFSDLVLLVGTNPLPNYVVGTYFLKQYSTDIKRVWLVYSEKTRFQAGTGEFAQNIKMVLAKERVQFTGEFLMKSLSDVGNADKICRDIQEKILNSVKKPDFTGVHLNYTGGTKAMAVHVYRQIEGAFPDKSSFSYLDARDYQLKADRGGSLTGDLRREIQLDFEDLIKLHGYKRVDKPEKHTVPPPEVREIILQSVRDLINYSGTPTAFIEHFCQEDPPPLSDPMIRRLIEPLTEYKKKYQEFMTGKWLEWYTESVIRQIIREHPELKTRNNIHVERNVYLERDGKELELDVVVLNGYQVTGITCSTSNGEKIAKLKGFEVIHRVRQIGGDEAKAIVISGLRDKTEKGVVTQTEAERVHHLKADLWALTGSTDRIKVLGVSDYANLGAILTDFIWGEEA